MLATGTSTADVGTPPRNGPSFGSLIRSRSTPFPSPDAPSTDEIGVSEHIAATAEAAHAVEVAIPPSATSLVLPVVASIVIVTVARDVTCVFLVMLGVLTST